MKRTKTGRFAQMVDKEWVISELERVNKPLDSLIIETMNRFGVTLGSARTLVYQIYKDWQLSRLTKGE